MMQAWSEYTLILLLAAGTLFTFIWLCLMRDRLRIKWYAALPIAVLHTVYGVLTVRVFAFMETGFSPEGIGNMSLFGGVFFMPLAYWAGARLFKRTLSDVFDIFTVCMVFTLMCARINCIFAGCCSGKAIPGLNGVCWPTRELEIIFYIVLLFILGRKIRKRQNHGEIYPLYMISYGAFRFITEGFRFYSGPSLVHPAHIWALIAVCVGFSAYTEIQKKYRGKKG